MFLQEEGGKLKLKAINIDISSGGPLIAIINREDAPRLDLHVMDRIKIRKGKKIETVVLDIAESSKVVPKGKLGVFDEVARSLGLKNNDFVDITIARKPLSLEYIRKNPEKAEKFVRYAAIQDHKAAKVAVELVGLEVFNEKMPRPFDDIEKAYEKIKPEFQQTDCKKCDTKRTAFTWDIDITSMVNQLGEPYKSLYLASYVMPTIHIHATLASAFSREAVHGTPEERNIQEAEVVLINAILILVLVMNSQSEIFTLGLDAETKACWDEVTEVWRDRPHGALAQGAGRQA